MSLLHKASRVAIACVLAGGLAAMPAQAQDSVNGGADGGAENHVKRPNILLIISDDVGIDATPFANPGAVEALLERYGPEGLNHPDYALIDGTPASTPALDQLADEGMVFTDAWAQPFCSPTRASMITGLFASRTGVQTYADALEQNHDSFVRRLSEQGGYSTAAIGKWHMAGLPAQDGPDYPGMKPKEAGFDFFRGNMHAALQTFWEYPLHIQDDGTTAGTWRTAEAPVASLPGIAPSTYAAVSKGEDAINWITAQEEADPDRPWFMWMAFNLAHATIIQQPSAMMVPNEDTLDEVSRAEMEACGGTFGTMEVGDCSNPALLRAMTNSMDTVIGHVLDTVDEIDPNTYVIYIGDNGTPMYGRDDLDFIDNMYITRTGRGKGSSFESGARVPLVIRGPGIEPGSQSSQIVHVADLYSTVLSLAGLGSPDLVPNSTGDAHIALDSVSLDPILRHGAQQVRDPDSDYIITEADNLMNGNVVAGARNARFKLTCVNDLADCGFFDLANDPLEEYPLGKPAMNACENEPMRQSEAWHYCFLLAALAEDSILNR